MNQIWRSCSLFVLLFGMLGITNSGSIANGQEARLAKPAEAFIQKHCFEGHGNGALQSAAIKSASEGPRLRRLSHSAMDRAAQDLLGTDLKLSQNLPADPAVSGFDNFSSTMVHSKDFMDTLQKNAREIAENVVTERRDPRQKYLFTGKRLVGGRKTERSGKRVVLFGSLLRPYTAWPHKFEARYSGRYNVADRQA